MKSFKNWMEDVHPQNTSTMGQPKGPLPLVQNQVATDLANKSLAKNPQFLANLSQARDNKQKLGLISQQTANIVNQNPGQIKAANVGADLLNQKIADTAGLDLKQFFMKK